MSLRRDPAEPRDFRVPRRRSLARLFALLVLAVTACGGPIGERFADVDALAMSTRWNGWVVVGRFGPQGPFRVVDVKRCAVSEPCSFAHQGQGHTYEGFTHYALVVLRLEGAGGAVSHLVLRSRERDYSK